MLKAPIVLCVIVAYAVASMAWMLTGKLLNGPAVLDELVGFVVWGFVCATIYTWLRDGWPAVVGVFRRTRCRTRQPSTAHRTLNAQSPYGRLSVQRTPRGEEALRGPSPLLRFWRT